MPHDATKTEALRQQLAISEAMRARAAQAAQAAREAAVLAQSETESLRGELDALRADAEEHERRTGFVAATLARIGSEDTRRLLRESRLREERLERQLEALREETRRLLDERDRLLLAAAPLSELELVLGSGLFDAAWYRRHYPDVDQSGLDPALHFLRVGLAEHRNPGPQFDCAGYLALHPDVAASEFNPLLHYLRLGHAEGRERRMVAAGAGPAANVSTPIAAPAQAQLGSQLRLVLISGEPDTPGHLYRVERLARAAEALGVATVIVRQDAIGTWLDAIAAADILLIWRMRWDHSIASAVTAARAGAARLVFDIDDLMIDPELARREVIDGIRTLGVTEANVREHYARVRDAMSDAEFCLTTTQELATHLRRHAKPTLVLPNGYDESTWRTSRVALRRRRLAAEDNLIRLGYAGGSRTHQRDFAVAAAPLARAMLRHPEARLVLFRWAQDGRPLLDTSEFPALAPLADRVEWRDMVPLARLPEEIARFDINLAPLEIGNPFCEAKSELKYFEAALLEVPTIASATGPFRRAIDQGRTGMLAANEADWDAALALLLDDDAARVRLGRAAYLDVLWPYGPEARVQHVALALDQIVGGRAGARAFELFTHRAIAARSAPEIPDGETLFLRDGLGVADVTVIVPLYNYAHHVQEALESVRAQTIEVLDLIVVDDCSTDDGLDVVLNWARRHAERFNRIEVRRNLANSGLGLTRNAGFMAAETPFVLPLDADNRLRPRCCKRLLAEVRAGGAAFAYPVIRQFSDATGRIGAYPYAPARLIGVPYIDAMALVSVAAWAGAGGYSATRLGWEDYDFWCRLAERGMHGVHVRGEPLAEYRVHDASMLRTNTDRQDVKPQVIAQMEADHRWLAIVRQDRLP